MMYFFSLVLLATPLLASELEARQTTRQYIVRNQCPTSINLYIAGVLDSVVPSQGTTTKFLGLGAGFFYSDVNGGNANGAGTTRAGFNEDFYYMVKDPNHINTGLRIVPQNQPSRMGFCAAIDCNDLDCYQAFPQPPTRFPAPTQSVAPPPPYYRCPIANVTYEITFCPLGSFPKPQIKGTVIHPGFNTAKCLDVRGAKYANGTPVQIYDCNNTPAQRWTINRGSTKVQLAGTNFCLDAGSSPANGVGLKIWQCYDNLAAQSWYYTDDNRIALQGKGLCTDLPNGVLTNSNQVQTWQCSANNPNQVWTL
ncbi:ricin B lectin domain-containing protein [Crassisporium funariophilum]|nr:ricin B lectin domain-containing protein [Crassisporium funariophilum]